MGLLHEITHCPRIQQWFDCPQCDNPCSKIISIQHSRHPDTLDQHQVPEPWSGDIEHAPILFLSSNPAIDENPSIKEREEFPLWSWPPKDIEDFFTHRYTGEHKQWIKNGIYYLQQNGSYSRKYVRFWASVRKRAEELLPKKDVKEGVDYALTEVVHCKSKGEEGVEEALQECATRYLRDVVKLSRAKVIVVLGGPAREAVEGKFKNELKDEFRLSNGDAFGPLQIDERQTYIVFLPHPNARVARTFKKRLNRETLQALRDFLNE